MERNVAGISTAFIGTFGEGAPYIGFLGEFDALSGLSQKADVTEYEPLKGSEIGHGYGHNLENPDALVSIKEEHVKKLEKDPYVCPIPAGVKPSIPSGK